MSSFWSAWIIVLTVISFALLFWLLFANRTASRDQTERTTGHVSDGIEEYDNPLPYWWFLMFVITMVFGIGYLIVYPGLGNFPGLMGWTQLGQYERQIEQAEQRYSAVRLEYLAMPVEEVAEVPAALKMGQRMFANNCSQCHGADARGSYGFPDLTDGDWLYGGDPAAIKTSITNGRIAAMPPWGPMLGDEGVRNVTAYVMRMSGRAVNDEHADAGKANYDMVCVACHMPDGSGNPMLGSPNLANGIWLYGGSEAEVSHSIREGRNGVMPAHADLLSEDKIHIITAYIYALNKAED
jgi:cytochrome c oxidase cbb3-type subunit 3